jgi:hypothetical protein
VQAAWRSPATSAPPAWPPRSWRTWSPPAEWWYRRATWPKKPCCLATEIGGRLVPEYPSSPREDLLAAWLAVGKEVAVVSHESALDLLDLSDVIPDGAHLTVARSGRILPTLPGVTIQTTVRSLTPRDLTYRDGMVLTSAPRTILDAAEAGPAPD